MKQRTDMASSQTLASRARPVHVTSKRIMPGHAALALGICSTLLYLGSAIVSFAYSYDQGSGRDKLTLMLLGLLLPLLLVVLVRNRIETIIGMLGTVLGLAAPLFGVAAMTIPGADRGTAAGNLAVLVPLAGCGLVWALTRSNWALLGVSGACLAVATSIIFDSGEYAAMLGIVIGTVIGYGYFWRHRISSPSRWLHVLDLSLLILALLLLSVYLLLILMPDRMGQIGDMLPS